jgi:hypothetical protein
MDMKHLIFAAIAIAVATPVAAQLYKWVDKDGKTHYSDTPPPGQESKSLSVGSGATTPTPAPASSGAKSAVERDKEAEAARQASRDSAKKAEDKAKDNAGRDEACSRAKSAHATYADGGRIHKYNDKGERVFLDDAEIEAERIRSQREMDEACKKT